MTKTPLFGPYAVAAVSAESWQAFFEQHNATVFPDEHSVSFESLLSATEKDQLAGLRRNLAGVLNLYFLLYDGEQPIGWHFGFQRSELEYFMANTGLLPAYQGRGIYSAFLKFLTADLVGQGFQFLTSIHHCDNNAVLIPKLKAGFLIQALGFLMQPMLLETNYGSMIQLVYPAKPLYREAFNARLGARALAEHVSRQLPG